MSKEPRMWLLAKKLDEQGIVPKDKSFVFKIPREHQGAAVMFQEYGTVQKPFLNNQPAPYELVTYQIYIYGNAGKLAETNELADKIYQFLRNNPSIPDAMLKGIEPKSPEFIDEQDNGKSIFFIELDAKYVPPSKVTTPPTPPTKTHKLNGKLNMSF